jgi:hypothetical protein
LASSDVTAHASAEELSTLSIGLTRISASKRRPDVAAKQEQEDDEAGRDHDGAAGGAHAEQDAPTAECEERGAGPDIAARRIARRHDASR